MSDSPYNHKVEITSLHAFQAFFYLLFKKTSIAEILFSNFLSKIAFFISINNSPILGPAGIPFFNK